MGVILKVGTLIVHQSYIIDHCPSYYAADYESLEVQPGDYDLYLEFVAGYNFPMPYYFSARLKTVRISGTLYSGFGGVNFAKTDLESGVEVEYVKRWYNWQINDNVNESVKFLSEFQDFIDSEAQMEWARIRIFSELRAMGAVCY